jgi:hypothetical protein
MIVGVEFSTDSRSRHCIIKKFSSLKAAKKWANSEENGKFEDAGSAKNDLPMTQQNFHKVLRHIHEMPVGWRMPSKKRIQQMKGTRSWECRSTDNQLIAQVLWSEEIKVPKQAHQGT